MDKNKLSWDLSERDPMIIEIKYDGERVMGLFLGEAMESAGRKVIMAHVKECNNSPWLKKWHDELMEEEVAILKGQPR